MAARIPEAAERALTQANFREITQQDIHLLGHPPHPTITLKSQAIILARLFDRMRVAEDADQGKGLKTQVHA